MAKIKFGMMMTDARGKLGGQVFSKNRGGAYVRTKVTPTNPQSVNQSVVRQLFGTIAQAWSALSNAVRAEWNTAVEAWKTTDIFGDLRTPSGKALHQRLNQQAQVAGYGLITNPPAKLEMVSGVVTAGQLAIGIAEISLTGAYAGADARVMLYATPQLSQGTKFVKDKLRNIYNVVANTYAGADAYDAYQTRFGAPTVGDNIYIGIVYVLPSGQASPMQVVKATVVA